MSKTIYIPYGNGYAPRDYQLDIWHARDKHPLDTILSKLDSGIAFHKSNFSLKEQEFMKSNKLYSKNKVLEARDMERLPGLGARHLILVHPRRSGKDFNAWNILIRETQLRVGAYYYFFPTNGQARKAVFEGIDEQGKRWLDYIPKELILKITQEPMSIFLKNGSIIYIRGTKDVDTSVIGSSALGVIFSEYPLQSPKGWSYVAPMIAKTRGFVIFTYTPRGKNHGWDIYQAGLQHLEDKKFADDWYVSKLTVDDIIKVCPDAYPEGLLESEKIRIYAEEKDLAKYYQEYFTDFDVAVQGAIYGAFLKELENEGRLRRLGAMRSADTIVSFDLGKSDSTAMTFFQIRAGRIQVVDYYEDIGGDAESHVGVLIDRGYDYTDIVLPHDGDHNNYTGRAIEQFRKYLPARYKNTLRINKRVARVWDRIKLVRTYFKHIEIDSERGDELVDKLKHYQRKFDEERKIYSDIPDHNFASHGADSFGEGIRYIDRQYKHLIQADKLNNTGRSINTAFYKEKKMFYAKETTRLINKIKNYG